MTDVLSLPFDQYQRYRLVADVVRELTPAGERLSLLDVGGRTALLRRFLEEADVQLVDVETSEEKGLVLGDGCHLPFQDGSFDVVAAFDTLEHVPPAAREAFVAECHRVARRYVVLAGPYQAENVEHSEVLLQRFLREKLQVEHRYLEEHRHNGLPDRAAVEGQFEGLGCQVLSVGHGNLERWLVLMCLSFYLDYDAALRGIAKDLFRYYNEHLYGSDHAQPVYSHVVIAARPGSPLPQPERLLPPPGAPGGAMELFGPLALDLLTFDRERAVWQEKTRQLEEINERVQIDLDQHRDVVDKMRNIDGYQAKVIGDLKLDLEGNRQTVAELKQSMQTEISGHESIRRDLEQDLAEHQGTIRDLNKDLADQIALREKGVEEFAETRRVLEQELAEHKVSLGEILKELEEATRERAAAQAEFESDLTEHGKVIAGLEEQSAAQARTIAEVKQLLEEQTAHGRALEEELVRVRAEAGQIETELKAQIAHGAHLSGVIEDQASELVERDALINQLRFELHSRGKNLARALAPKKRRY